MAKTLTWVLAQPSGQWIEHSGRTAAAVTISLLVVRLVNLPEAYWAPITTMVVTQSALGATWTISLQRFIGTALGAAAGALLVTFWGGNVVAFAAGVFVLGLICAVLRLERNAYRYAGITLAIVMLIGRSAPAWSVAVHRFVEVALGIAVSLAFAAVWPEDP